MKPNLPLIPGHEAIGYMAACGPDVTNGGYAECVLADSRYVAHERDSVYCRLEDINEIFDKMKANAIEGRMVMKIAEP